MPGHAHFKQITVTINRTKQITICVFKILSSGVRLQAGLRLQDIKFWGRNNSQVFTVLRFYYGNLVK